MTTAGSGLTNAGSGLTNATVVLKDAAGNSRSARTTNFGNYLFDEVEVGQTCGFCNHFHSLLFAPQTISIT